MVITTQTGKSFLAGAGTGCVISTAPAIEPVKQEKGSGPLRQSADKLKEYYDRTGSQARQITWGNHFLGRYDTLDRAQQVAADFKNAVDSGAQAFTFPKK